MLFPLLEVVLALRLQWLGKREDVRGEEKSSPKRNLKACPFKKGDVRQGIIFASCSRCELDASLAVPKQLPPQTCFLRSTLQNPRVLQKDAVVQAPSVTTDHLCLAVLRWAHQAGPPQAFNSGPSCLQSN